MLEYNDRKNYNGSYQMKIDTVNVTLGFFFFKNPRLKGGNDK